MKENGFKIWLKSTGQKVKDIVVPALCAIIPGVIIGGSIVAIADSYKLDKLEKDHGKLVNTFNNNVDKHNSFVDWTHEEIEKLTRQNNELLERALRETEGKAS
jgi:hypothetical protein